LEGDLLVGHYGRSHTVILVERHSCYLLLLPLLDATTRTVVAAVTAVSANYVVIPAWLAVWRRGTQTSPPPRHPGLFLRRLLPVQRGSNQNSNGHVLRPQVFFGCRC
jgi:hypothetical protein